MYNRFDGQLLNTYAEANKRIPLMHVWANHICICVRNICSQCPNRLTILHLSIIDKFTRSSGLTCIATDILEYRKTLQEALAACLRNGNCSMVYSECCYHISTNPYPGDTSDCTTKIYNLCPKNSIKITSQTNCVYLRRNDSGTIIPFARH